MFDGGGYGVGVTVTPLGPMPWDDVSAPAGVEVHPTRLGELMPVHRRTQAERAAEIQRVIRAEGALAAYKAELVAAMARDSASADDRPSGQPGAASPVWARDPADDPLPEASEFFPDELALVLNCSRAAATTLAEVSTTLTERLPATWAALADGLLDWPRARTIAVELGWPAREVAPELVAEVEAAVLPVAGELSVKRLKATVQRELLSRDANAADRRRKQAERAADVTVHPVGDGMSELRALMPTPLAVASRAAVDAYAHMAKADGDPRPIGHLRVGVLGDLTLRPWDTSRPPVTAEVTIVAPLEALRSAAPFAPPDLAAQHANRLPAPVAEVSGQPITAAHVRELLAQLDSLCPGGLRAPTAGTLTVAITDADGGLRATVTRPELERLARRGCVEHGPAPCECAVLDRPAPPGSRYRPTPAQYRFTRTRDRTCRYPGCSSRAAWADVDHVVPHGAGGATDCDNLCCLCRRHHRLKTHADGWRFALTPDGVLSVTTPTGVTRTTRPPGLTLLAEHFGTPPDPVPADDDPPPF
ncbi:MAG: DUF222 domain-containing protein [Blastococcus sp.]